MNQGHGLTEDGSSWDLTFFAGRCIETTPRGTLQSRYRSLDYKVPSWFRSDLAKRQRLLKHFSRFRGDLRVGDIEGCERVQSPEIFQSFVGDLSAAEMKFHQVSETLEMPQTGTGNCGVVETDFF